jgi:hypothetical protein
MDFGETALVALARRPQQQSDVTGHRRLSVVEGRLWAMAADDASAGAGPRIGRCRRGIAPGIVRAVVPRTSEVIA